MDWVEEEDRALTERPGERNTWRDSRLDYRLSRKGLEERLEGWMTRGRELVDGVSGTRPGTRSIGRGAERAGGTQGGLDGLGRWVESRLDWLLDDREDWREPWQEGARPPREGWESPPSQPSRRSRAPLEAISRRGLPGSAPGRSGRPTRPEGAGMEPARTIVREPEQAPRATGPTSADTSADPWPEEETFSVPRWRREAPLPPAANPLADPEPVSPPGRPLPRSTRRRQGQPRLH